MQDSRWCFWLLVPYPMLILFWYIIIKLLQWSYQRWKLLKTFQQCRIPGPKPGFLRGNIRLLDRQYLFRSFDGWFGKYGDTIGYYRGDRAVLVTKNLQLIQEIFLKRFREFPNRLKFILELQPFSSSILARRDDRWRQTRRVLTPAFNATKISSLQCNQTIANTLCRLLSLFQNDSIIDSQDNDYIERFNGTSLKINVSNLSKRFTLDIICRFAFEIDDEDFFGGHSKLFKMAEQFFAESCDNILIRLAMVAPFMKIVLRFINDYITSGPIIDYLVRYLKQQIIRYDLAGTRSDVGAAESDDPGSSRQSGRKLLDFVLKQIKLGYLDENEAIGNLLVVLLAGYETTSNGISFVLYNLAKHQSIQDRLRTELERLDHVITGEESPNEIHNDQNHCEYLDRIILESLRLYPPVIDYVIREQSDNAPEVQQINIDGRTYSIPKHVAIQVPVWTIHHDPEIWPDPYRFDPDRSELPVSGQANVRKTTFLAFGIGQRSCIGGSLAMAEMRSVVSALVRRYQIKLSDTFRTDRDLDSDGLLKVKAFAELIEPCEDIKLIFEPLTQSKI